jgi:DNA repair protein RadC
MPTEVPPSGTLYVNTIDREVTEQIKETGELMGIRLDDHIIIADDDFVSAL